MGAAAELVGMEPFKQWLDKLNDEFKTPDPVLKKIGSRIANEVIPDYFEEKKSPDGDPWPDLTPAYKKRKMKDKGTEDLLIGSGELLRSVGFKVVAGKLVVGAGNADTPYARRHNKGGNKDHPMPQRQFIGIGEKESEVVNDAITEWLRKASG